MEPLGWPGSSGASPRNERGWGLPSVDPSHPSAGYVQSLLAKAGNASQLFDPAALDRVSELSRGNPRELNRLCELSLMAAMAAADTQVDEATVESVAREFTAERRSTRAARQALVASGA